MNPESEQFFIFSDNSPVKPAQARNILKIVLQKLNLSAELYGMHSFRIGRTRDLIKFNYSIEEVKIKSLIAMCLVYKHVVHMYHVFANVMYF